MDTGVAGMTAKRWSEILRSIDVLEKRNLAIMFDENMQHCKGMPTFPLQKTYNYLSV